ncbi:phage head completion protein [Microvirga massiliensis]|uniref:phage head completion protein n=1 Tax=Microvirga massiliensis TaxID=1033741 RepID=UPI000660E320|nr:head-tail adaptor protein [Microvirga massiliensis]
MTAAGLLNRRASFRRRAPVPEALGTLRGGFEPLGDPVWAGIKDTRPRDVTIGGLALQVRTATLTLHDSAFARSLTTSDQVVVDGESYEIAGILHTERPDGMLRLDLNNTPGRAQYDREFSIRGEVVTMRRVVPNAPAIEAVARAIVVGYQPDELIGGITQGERRVYVAADDLERAGWPIPPKVNDRIIVRGRSLNVLSVDDSTHRIAGELMVYDIRASG